MIKFRQKNYTIQEGHYTGPKDMDKVPGAIEVVGKSAFGGSIIGVLPMFFMSIGWLNMPIFDPPYVGVFLEGFLTNMDWRDVIFQVIQVVLSFAVYFPFFKILEKQQLKIEQSNDTKSGYEFSQLDLALLGDIDF